MKQEGLLSRYKQQRLLAVLPSGMDKKSAGCGSQLVGPPDPESPAAAPSRQSVKGRIPPKDLPPTGPSPEGPWPLVPATVYPGTPLRPPSRCHPVPWAAPSLFSPCSVLCIRVPDCPARQPARPERGHFPRGGYLSRRHPEPYVLPFRPLLQGGAVKPAWNWIPQECGRGQPGLFPSKPWGPSSHQV